LASLSPDAFLSYSSGIINSNYRLNRMLQDHLAAVRSSGDLMRMSVGSHTDSTGTMMAPSMAPSNRGNFWGSLSYDWQDYKGDQSNSGFDGETGAVTAGFDYRVAPALVLGIAFDGSRSNFHGSNSSSDIDSYRGLIYGTWGESTGIYTDFVAGYGKHSLDLNRRLGGILGGSSSSSTDASSYQAMGTVGYAFGDSKVKHGPFAGLEYQTVRVDGFTQGGVLPVRVQDYDDNSFRGLIGYRVNANLGRFTPYASVAYAHEFEENGINTNASFGGASFHLRGAQRGSAVVITTGTGISLTNTLQLDVGYRGEISVENNGIDSHGGSIGLNYSF
jgi:outer membrane lipase/esterase